MSKFPLQQQFLKISIKKLKKFKISIDIKRFGINAIESAIYRLGTSQEDKAFDRESENYIVGIAKWFIEKEFTSNQRQSLVKLEDEKIIKETEKAYKIAFFTEYGLFEKWIPKSVFKMEHTNVSFAY